MSTLHFVCNHDGFVFTFTASGDRQWRFTRLSPFQQAKGQEKFVLLPEVVGQVTQWVVEDHTSGARVLRIGQPQEVKPGQETMGPPLGRWLIWGTPFVLTNRTPRNPPVPFDPPFPLVVPFLTMQYSEQGRVARLELTMHEKPIVDDLLEQMLARIRAVLQNLARRPEMVLFIRSDARNSAVPAVRHVKRFLRFVQENGTALVLVGRGSAIVLRPYGILGHSLFTLIRLVQRLLPSPWPESVVPNMEDAEEFLQRLAEEALVGLSTPKTVEPEPECCHRAENPAAAAAPAKMDPRAAAVAVQAADPAALPGCGDEADAREGSLAHELLPSVPEQPPLRPVAIPESPDPAIRTRATIESSVAPGGSQGACFCGICR